MSLEKYKHPDFKQEVLTWINSNLANYLKKNEENQTEIEHILDYLNSDTAPERLKKMSYKQAKESAEKWIQSLVKKAADIIETDADVETFLEFDGGYRFVKLIGKAAFQREGNLMSHCVASYHGKSNTTIYSLRDNKNQPHCTIEVNSSTGRDGKQSINQIKGKGNGSIHPNYIRFVLEFLKKIDVEVRSYEMKNLGYEDLEEEAGPGSLNWLREQFDGIRTITFQNKEYFYTHSKLVEKVATKELTWEK